MTMALQRVMVRMLHDPALVDRVYGGGRVPELDPAELGMLRAVDRRAWSTDPWRRARLVTALAEEFVVSAAVLGAPGLDAFCSSSEFHAGIQKRESMASAFGRWLLPKVGEVATLEATMARARRSPAHTAEVSLNVGVAACSVPGGMLAAWQAAKGQLGPAPLDAVVAGARVSRPAGKGREGVLIAGDGASLVGDDLVRLLVRIEPGLTRAGADAVVRKLGGGPELLDELAAEGLLRLVPRGT